MTVLRKRDAVVEYSASRNVQTQRKNIKRKSGSSATVSETDVQFGSVYLAAVSAMIPTVPAMRNVREAAVKSALNL